MISEINVYDLHTLNFDKDTLKKIKIDNNEYDDPSNLFAIQITYHEKHMEPKYSNKDIVIFKKADIISKADDKDCILKIKNIYLFSHVNLQNEFLILTPHDRVNCSDSVKTFKLKEVENLPIKVVGIAKERRTKID